ncbi:hypothetical protein BBK36DRAFT_16858 [Trichoderma citrinoviride]|uniref:Uncharacterized protein n=1 Tax=Trichoderma citrinoviride TaxID=58853 RepID=A0A2T4BJK9_9HYPO|nr:hypothetical protein BBK36DRAFT_16858 [Trichoderma citrinoviride]PTB69461.1 hypothetical protein BBK36DRAFT_16858 [Trichoderma citrinoviride]
MVVDTGPSAKKRRPERAAERHRRHLSAAYSNRTALEARPVRHYRRSKHIRGRMAPAWDTRIQPHSWTDLVQPPYCCAVIIVRHDLPFGNQQVANGMLHCTALHQRRVTYKYEWPVERDPFYPLGSLSVAMPVVLEAILPPSKPCLPACLPAGSLSQQYRRGARLQNDSVMLECKPNKGK